MRPRGTPRALRRRRRARPHRSGCRSHNQRLAAARMLFLSFPPTVFSPLRKQGPPPSPAGGGGDPQDNEVIKAADVPASPWVFPASAISCTS